MDIAKGIAIIAIVIGHLSFREPGDTNFIHNAIYQFHVPIFFLLAGCFLNPTKSTRAFVASRARRLLMPYVVTCVTIGIIIYTLSFVGDYRSLAGTPFHA